MTTIKEDNNEADVHYEYSLLLLANKELTGL